jgi:hypothetical protein
MDTSGFTFSFKAILNHMQSQRRWGYVHTVTFSSVSTLKRMQTLSIYDRSCCLFNILEIFSFGSCQQGVKTIKGKRRFWKRWKTTPVCTYNLSIYSVIKCKSRCLPLFYFKKIVPISKFQFTDVCYRYISFIWLDKGVCTRHHSSLQLDEILQTYQSRNHV